VVWDAAVEKAYGGKRKVHWAELYLGEKAAGIYDGDYFPQETLDAIKELNVAIKGPLTTPVGEGFRSLNVSLRQTLDLYACVRPVKYYKGVPSPLRKPEDFDVVIFRENTEDVYSGIEFESGTPENKKLADFLRNEMGAKFFEDAGLGVKPISEFGTKRLVRKAIEYAIENKRESVTLVHKGNIMKFHRVRHREQARVGDAGAQGQHHEVHRGRLPQVGLRGGGRGIRRRHHYRRRTLGQA